MALFLGVHEMGRPMTDDEAAGIWAKYKAACEQRGCKALRVHASPAAGKAFCLTQANSADEVKAAHEGGSFPLKEIVEVRVLE